MATAKTAKTSPKKTVKSEVVGTKVEVVQAASGKRELVGEVVSDKMEKTIVVKVSRRVRHPLYRKYVVRSRRFKAHDAENTAHTGDLVRIVESRPISKDKCWALKEIVRKGSGLALQIAN